MVSQLMWIAAVYGAAVLLVHALHKREVSQRSRSSGRWIHFVLVTRNHEAVVEWYMRALTLQSLFTGKRVRVTLVDQGSTDRTVDVVRRVRPAGYMLEYCREETEDRDGYQALPDSALVMDLRMPGGPLFLPWMRIAEGRRERSEGE